MSFKDAVGRRLPVRRPNRKNAANSYACPRCDVLLHDGVAYRNCPACDAAVDWVNLRKPIWCCRSCDRMVNRKVEGIPFCERCQKGMVEVEPPPEPDEARGDISGRLLPRIREIADHPAFLLGLWLFALLPVLSLALHPVWRWMALALIGPLLLVPVAMGGFVLHWFASGFPELIALARDRRTRVVHGLEHATANVLAGSGARALWGRTHDGSRFELTLHGKKGTDPKAFRAAVERAIERLLGGERELAFHPRCGSTWLMLFVLAALGAVAMGFVGLFLQITPWTLLAFVGSVICAVYLGFAPAGRLLQEYGTVSATFTRARVVRIQRRGREGKGRIAYDVEVAVDLDAASGEDLPSVDSQHDEDARTVAAGEARDGNGDTASPRKPESPEDAPRAAASRIVEAVRGSCRSCGWEPSPRAMWRCGCGWRWHALATDGSCPACGHTFVRIPCRRCGSAAPIEDWLGTDIGAASSG